jgi:hypothetical protein
MTSDHKVMFQRAIEALEIDTEHVIIKPNWVSSQPGQFTEALLLEWLLEVLPGRAILVESYTPWRGLRYTGPDELGIGLASGKQHWDFYRTQDRHFLEQTGTRAVMHRFGARYVNVTNEVWAARCAPTEVVRALYHARYSSIGCEDLFGWVPAALFDIRDQATLISLAKIKTECCPDKRIKLSGAIKNLFGLIPHPSRYDPFHGEKHGMVHASIADAFCLYDALFARSAWIAEGIRTVVGNNCCEGEYVDEHLGLLVTGRDPIAVDSQACELFNIDAGSIDYLRLIRGRARAVGHKRST